MKIVSNQYYFNKTLLLWLQRTRKEKKTYSEDWAFGDEEEIEGLRSFSIQDKLDSTRYAHNNFVKQMDGKGMYFYKYCILFIFVFFN